MGKKCNDAFLVEEIELSDGHNEAAQSELTRKSDRTIPMTKKLEMLEEQWTPVNFCWLSPFGSRWEWKRRFRIRRRTQVFKIGSKLVTVRKNWREHGKKKADKNWVLTAYDEEATDGDMSAIATANRGQVAQTTANSTDKVSDFSSDLQGKGGERLQTGGDLEGATRSRHTGRAAAGGCWQSLRDQWCWMDNIHDVNYSSAL